MGFSEKSLYGGSDAAFIGIEAENWGKWEGINTDHYIVRLHQSAYAVHVVREFEKAVEHPLRMLRTPEKYCRDSMDAALAEIPGIFAEQAAMYVGQLLWLARGTRPDLAHAVQRLSTRIHGWTCEEDQALYHLMLKGTVSKSL